MFLEAEIIFYIRGHTKNAADRLFNQLKLNFHNKNLYTVDQCIEQFNKGKHVEAIRLTLGVMKDYYNFENHLYKTFDTNVVTKSHVFKSSNDLGPGVIECKRTCTETTTNIQKLQKGPKGNCRKSEFLSYTLVDEPEPGISEQKQLDLFEKWRKFVPDEFQDIICPEPKNDLTERVKEKLKEKNRTNYSKRKEKKTSAKRKHDEINI